MENFVVSARKYRPATFDSVIGQEHITHTLKNAIRNNHLAHAFLFCGPRGVGKTTCARILAKTINCQNITADVEACNECDSCKSFNDHASFNIYELDAASNNSVDDIRGLVEQVRYAPQGAKYKIYIIDEVHMLTSQAFNAFLKTLEEPPPYAKFILATTERHKILPTILSRCQVFDFHRIRIEHAVSQLKIICTNEGITAEEEALHIIAQKADGAMRDALSIFDRIVSFTGKNITYKDVIANLNILDYEYYFKATDMVLVKNLPGLLLLFNEVLENGFDAQHFISGFMEHIRNLLVCKYPNTIGLMEVAPAVAQRFVIQANQSPATLLLNGLNLINQCELEYKASKNQRLHVELMLMKLSHLQSVIEIADLKKKIADQSEYNYPAEIAETQLPKPLSESKVEETAPLSPIPSKPLPKEPVKQAGSSLDKLSKLRQQLSEEKKADDEPEKQITKEPSTEKNETLTTESFGKAWDDYILYLDRQGKKSLSVTYKNAAWEITDDSQVLLTLASSHEKEMFEQDQMQILPFLRQALNNRSLEFMVKVNQQFQFQHKFTAEDKFKAIAEQHPLINDLRNALGLEIE
jgi:DNA polymerase-3 subunit gamma/tau